jgi:hypothetical protein
MSAHQRGPDHQRFNPDDVFMVKFRDLRPIKDPFASQDLAEWLDSLGDHEAAEALRERRQREADKKAGQ